jgi:hypothetical protein
MLADDPLYFGRVTLLLAATTRTGTRTPASIAAMTRP